MNYIIKTRNNRNVRTLLAPLADRPHAHLPNFDGDVFATERAANDALAEGASEWVYADACESREAKAIDLDAEGGDDRYEESVRAVYNAAIEEILREGRWSYDGVDYAVVEAE